MEVLAEGEGGRMGLLDLTLLRMKMSRMKAAFVDVWSVKDVRTSWD